MTAEIALTQPAISGSARLWVLLRLPLIFVLLFLLREQLIDLSESIFSTILLIQFVINRVSTPLTRIEGAAIAFVVFLAIGALVRRFAPERWRYVIAIVACTLVIVATQLSLGGDLIWLPFCLLPLATNWAPFTASPRLLAAMPGTEMLFADQFFAWFFKRPSQRVLMPGAFLGALMLGLALPNAGIVGAERAQRAGVASQVVVAGDLNGLALDETGRYLFVGGHGLEHLWRYDTQRMSAPPAVSPSFFDGAQGVVYDPINREIFFHRQDGQQLVTLDADTLREVRVASVADLSPGDSWIEYEPNTDTLSIVSEADTMTGSPVLILDRLSGRVVARRPEDAGNTALNPNIPALYMSNFRRDPLLMAYDVARHVMIARVRVPMRMERLIYDPNANEVMATAPLSGRVMRYDAATLNFIGAVNVPFGTRTLAIDQGRRQMLAGSFATGEVALIDMRTWRKIQSWYLGPWLRTIAIAPERGVAYVSSRGALYTLQYAPPTRSP